MVTLRGGLSTIVIGALLLAGATASGGGGPARARRGQEANPRTGMAMPSFDLLVRAVKQRDRGATQRIVGRMGPGRLVQGLAQTDRHVVLAVLAAAPEARGAALLGDGVANLAACRDPGVGQA